MRKFVELKDVEKMILEGKSIGDLKVYQADYFPHMPIRVRDYGYVHDGKPEEFDLGRDINHQWLHIQPDGSLEYVNMQNGSGSMDEKSAEAEQECCFIPDYVSERYGRIESYITPQEILVINEGEAWKEDAEDDDESSNIYLPEILSYRQRIALVLERENRICDIQDHLAAMLEEGDIEPWRFEYAVNTDEILDRTVALYDKYADCNVAYNVTLDTAIKEAVKDISLTPKLLEELWNIFENVPINNEDEILDDFMGYEKGTDRFEIWHWFDEHYPNGVAALTGAID